MTPLKSVFYFILIISFLFRNDSSSKADDQSDEAEDPHNHIISVLSFLIVFWRCYAWRVESENRSRRFGLSLHHLKYE